MILKKIFIITLLLTLLAIQLSSCQSTTTTEKSLDYRYGLNEEIKIIDIESKEKLATLKITNARIISEEPFDVQEFDKYDESSNKVYKTVTYNQIIQVDYVYSGIDSSRSISYSNFSITDIKGKSVDFDPETNFKKKSAEGQSSMFIALINISAHIDISFNYSTMQFSPTAKLRIEVSRDGIAPQIASSSKPKESSAVKSSSSKPNKSSAAPSSSINESSEPQSEKSIVSESKSSTVTAASSYPSSDEAIKNSNNDSKNYMQIIYVLLLVIIALAAGLIIVATRKYRK